MTDDNLNFTLPMEVTTETNTTDATTSTTLSQAITRVTAAMTKAVTSATTESFVEITSTMAQTTQTTWNPTGSTATTTAINATNKTCTTTTTEEPFDEFGPPEGVEYIFVPLGVMIFVIVLSAVVLIVSRRRKMERLRHRLMPLYNFDPGEEGEDDWETELLDEGFGNRQRRQGYQSMDSEENSELFGPH